MSDKALSSAELELTQRFQTHFPQGEIDNETLRRWNSKPKTEIAAFLKHALIAEPLGDKNDGPLFTLWDVYSPPFIGQEAKFKFKDFLDQLKEGAPQVSVTMDPAFEEEFLNLEEVYREDPGILLLAHRLNRPLRIDFDLSREMGGRQYVHCSLRHVAYVARKIRAPLSNFVFHVLDRMGNSRVIKLLAYCSAAGNQSTTLNFSALEWRGSRECLRPGDLVASLMCSI